MFSRIWKKLTLRRKREGFHSQFGGLWTDRTDARAVLAARQSRDELDPAAAERIAFWIERGYVILEGAVPTELCDAVTAEVDRIWENADERFLIELDGELHPPEAALRSKHTKLLDLFAHFKPALELAFAPAIHGFLRDVFEANVLLFQSLNFERGSAQPIHQDTAYVVVNPPLNLAAAWIALEDVQPGSGELMYYPGSHRIGEYLFRAGARNWNRKRDGTEEREQYEASLHSQAAERGLELAKFLPKKGDALIWSADLAHGGAPIEDPHLTRRSFVCHYCPAETEPYYFSYKNRHRTVREVRPGCSIASSHVELE